MWGAESRRKLCSSVYFGEGGQISCEVCANTRVEDKQVFCGTDHAMAADCLVLKDMNNPKPDDDAKLFRTDLRGRFLLSALRLGDRMVARPSLSRIAEYMEGMVASNARRIAILKVLPADESTQVKAGPKQGGGRVAAAPVLGGGTGGVHVSGGEAGDGQTGAVPGVGGGDGSGEGPSDEAKVPRKKSRPRGKSIKSRPRESAGLARGGRFLSSSAATTAVPAADAAHSARARRKQDKSRINQG